MKAWLGLALALCILCLGSAQQAPCAADEILNNASNTCDCNLTMYTYTQHEYPIFPVQCLSGEMQLKVSRCQLEKSGYDSSNLHLLDPSCVGQRVVDGTSEVVVSTQTSSHVCGNIMSLNGTHVVYSNHLTIPAKISTSGLIWRQNITFNFSCSYPLNIPVSLTTTLNIVVGAIDRQFPPGVGAVTGFMVAYTDSAFTLPYNDVTMVVNVQDPLYVSVSMPDLDATTFSVLVTRLYATATSDPNATPAFDIITDRCPSAQLSDLLTVMMNGRNTEARFTVLVFQIAGSSSLYLHAEVQICTSNPCNQTCGSS